MIDTFLILHVVIVHTIACVVSTSSYTSQGCISLLCQYHAFSVCGVCPLALV